MVLANAIPSTVPKPRSERPTVVCVDDEPLVRQALYRLLRKEPYAVFMAETPGDALDFVRGHPVDMIITDQRMPGMSGVELLQEARKSDPDVAGLILTAYPESVFTDDIPGPIAPLYSKPWDDDTLRAGIGEILRTRGCPWESRVPQAVLNQGPEMPTLSPTGTPGDLSLPQVAVRTALVWLDGAKETELALDSVLQVLSVDAVKIILLRVMAGMGLSRDVYSNLQRLRQRLSLKGIDASADVRWGDPAEQILLHARHADADLILLPRLPVGRIAKLFGRGLVERVIQRSEIPVLVFPTKPAFRSWKYIVVPLDGSREAEGALPDAVRVAKMTGAAIGLVYVEPWPLSEFGPFYVQDRTPYLTELSQHLEIEGISTEIHSLFGKTEEEIGRFLEHSDTDLVCMTTRGRRGLLRFLNGSTVETVIRHAPCPVMVRRVVAT